MGRKGKGDEDFAAESSGAQVGELSEAEAIKVENLVSSICRWNAFKSFDKISFFEYGKYRNNKVSPIFLSGAEGDCFAAKGGQEGGARRESGARQQVVCA